MPAAPLAFISKPLVRHEVVPGISTMNRQVSLWTRHVNYGNTINVVFLIFRKKKAKNSRIFALLTTEVSS